MHVKIVDNEKLLIKMWVLITHDLNSFILHGLFFFFDSSDPEGAAIFLFIDNAYLVDNNLGNKNLDRHNKSLALITKSNTYLNVFPHKMGYAICQGDPFNYELDGIRTILLRHEEL